MITSFRNWIAPFFRRKEEGQGMVEYALLVGLIAVVVIAALVLLGDGIKAKFNEIVSALGEHRHRRSIFKNVTDID